MDDGQPLLLVDVRTPTEFAGGHIPGAVNHPVADVAQWSQTLGTQQRVCCVCQAGGRSQTAADYLVDHGFRYVYNLLGGMDQWTGPTEP